MDSVFLLDGKVYNAEVEKDPLERSFAMADTEQSRRTLDCTVDRDIIGTFYNYTMKVYPETEDLAAHDTLYDAVPDSNYASHEMTFPYGRETLASQACITQGKDKLRIRRGKNIWGLDDLFPNFAAMEPRRR